MPLSKKPKPEKLPVQQRQKDVKYKKMYLCAFSGAVSLFPSRGLHKTNDAPRTANAQPQPALSSQATHV